MDLEKLINLSREELIKELKKLPPEKRIKKIQEIEEARKKEEEETKKLMEETIQEINLEDRIPEKDHEEETERARKTFDISQLEPSLEEEIQSTQQENIGSIPPSYQETLQQITGLYTELRDIIEEQAQTPGYDNLYRAEEIYNEIINKEKYQPDENIKDIAYGTRKLMKELRGEYMSQFYKD